MSKTTKCLIRRKACLPRHQEDGAFFSPKMFSFMSADLNRPYHGFRSHFDEWANRLEITVFVWKSDAK